MQAANSEFTNLHEATPTDSYPPELPSNEPLPTLYPPEPLFYPSTPTTPSNETMTNIPQIYTIPPLNLRKADSIVISDTQTIHHSAFNDEPFSTTSLTFALILLFLLWTAKIVLTIVDIGIFAAYNTPSVIRSLTIAVFVIDIIELFLIPIVITAGIAGVWYRFSYATRIKGIVIFEILLGIFCVFHCASVVLHCLQWLGVNVVAISFAVLALCLWILSCCVCCVAPSIYHGSTLYKLRRMRISSQ